MGETDWGGKWVLFWWAGPCSVNLSSNFLLIGGAVLFTWCQTVVEVMKIMETSCKRSHACIAILTAPALQQATADPRLHRRLLDTHGQVWVSLLCGHCSFLLGLSAHKVWALWASLVGVGFDSKCDFTPPTIFLGLLCPWTWGISSQPLQIWPYKGHMSRLWMW